MKPRQDEVVPSPVQPRWTYRISVVTWAFYVVHTPHICIPQPPWRPCLWEKSNWLVLSLLMYWFQWHYHRQLLHRHYTMSKVTWE